MYLFIISFFFVISIILSVFIVYQYQKFKALNLKLAYLAKKNSSFEQEIKALLNADIVFGRSVSSLKDQLNSLDDRQARVENRRNNDGGYQHALKLLSLGSSIDEIIKDCNISPAEAELLANLQAYQMAKG